MFTQVNLQKHLTNLHLLNMDLHLGDNGFYGIDLDGDSPGLRAVNISIRSIVLMIQCVIGFIVIKQLYPIDDFDYRLIASFLFSLFCACAGTASLILLIFLNILGRSTINRRSHLDMDQRELFCLFARHTRVEIIPNIRGFSISNVIDDDLYVHRHFNFAVCFHYRSHRFILFGGVGRVSGDPLQCVYNLPLFLSHWLRARSVLFLLQPIQVGDGSAGLFEG